MQYVFTLYTLYRWYFPSHFQGAGPAEPWNTGFIWSSWRDAWNNTLHKNWLGCQGRRHCDAPLHSCSWALRVIGEGRRDPGHVRATSFQGHALSSDAAKLFSMCLHGLWPMSPCTETGQSSLLISATRNILREVRVFLHCCQGSPNNWNELTQTCNVEKAQCKPIAQAYQSNRAGLIYLASKC